MDSLEWLNHRSIDTDWLTFKYIASPPRRYPNSVVTYAPLSMGHINRLLVVVALIVAASGRSAGDLSDISHCNCHAASSTLSWWIQCSRLTWKYFTTRPDLYRTQQMNFNVLCTSSFCSIRSLSAHLIHPCTEIVSSCFSTEEFVTRTLKSFMLYSGVLILHSFRRS